MVTDNAGQQQAKTHYQRQNNLFHIDTPRLAAY
jgi:hypothetical protein